jgi:hypothetical protein
MVEHAARMGQKRSTYRNLVRKSQGENNLEDIVLDGRIVLDLNL